MGVWAENLNYFLMKETFDFLNSNSLVREAPDVLKAYPIIVGETHFIPRKFSQLKSDRNIYSKRNVLPSCDGILFHSLLITSPLNKRISETNIASSGVLQKEQDALFKSLAIYN